MMNILDGYEPINASDLIDGYYINRDGKIYRDYGERIKFLNDRSNAYGYRRISLIHKDGRRVDRLLHRLLMLTFVSNGDNKPQVNHIDGNKKNNCLSNLEWTTDLENKIHAHEVLGNRTSSKDCGLFYMGDFIQSFPNIQNACSYAVENYKCSYSSLEKYFTSNGCAIIKGKCNDYPVVE